MSSYAAQSVGGIFSAAGALQKGKATADTLNQQAQVQQQNADQARLAAKANVDRLSVMAMRHMGAMTTSYAASGVDQDSGSVSSVIAASAANAELDKQNIIHGGEIRAVNFENQKSLDQTAATHAIRASYWNAFSSMVAGGAGAESQFGGAPGKKGGGDPYATDYSAGDAVTAEGGNAEVMGDATNVDGFEGAVV